MLVLNSPGGTRHHAMAHSATLSPSPEGLFILILSDVSKLLMDFVVLVHKDIFAECNGY